MVEALETNKMLLFQIHVKIVLLTLGDIAIIRGSWVVFNLERERRVSQMSLLTVGKQESNTFISKEIKKTIEEILVDHVYVNKELRLSYI